MRDWSGLCRASRQAGTAHLWQVGVMFTLAQVADIRSSQNSNETRHHRLLVSSLLLQLKGQNGGGSLASTLSTVHGMCFESSFSAQ